MWFQKLVVLISLHGIARYIFQVIIEIIKKTHLRWKIRPNDIPDILITGFGVCMYTTGILLFYPLVDKNLYGHI